MLSHPSSKNMLPRPSSPEFPGALKARRELRRMSRAALARAANITKSCLAVTKSLTAANLRDHDQRQLGLHSIALLGLKYRPILWKIFRGFFLSKKTDCSVADLYLIRMKRSGHQTSCRHQPPRFLLSQELLQICCWKMHRWKTSSSFHQVKTKDQLFVPN